MKVSNSKYNFSWKKKIQETLKENPCQIEEPIIDVVKELNEYNWCMTTGSCGGHNEPIVDWKNNIIHGMRKKFPYVSFVIKDEEFVDFLIKKITETNNSTIDFSMKISPMNTIVKEWVGINEPVMVITITFRSLAFNIGRVDKFQVSQDEDVNRLNEISIFMLMKEHFKRWFIEYDNIRL